MQCLDRGVRLIIKKVGVGCGVFSGGLSFFQAEDGIRDVERSRGLGDVYKRQHIFKRKDQLQSNEENQYF